MATCPECGTATDTLYDCPDCGDEFCVDCRLPQDHECPENEATEGEQGDSTTSGESTSEYGVVKRNAGWILAGLMAIGSLGGGLPANGPYEALGALIGIGLATYAIGRIAQHFNGWHQPGAAN